MMGRYTTIVPKLGSRWGNGDRFLETFILLVGYSVLHHISLLVDLELSCVDITTYTYRPGPKCTDTN